MIAERKKISAGLRFYRQGTRFFERRFAANLLRRSTMERLLAAILVLGLAGCSDSTRYLNQSKPQVALAPPTKQFVPRDLPPEIRAEAPKGANESKEVPLMECMSEACRVKCSPKVEKESRPKWCAYFKEPI